MYAIGATINRNDYLTDEAYFYAVLKNAYDVKLSASGDKNAAILEMKSAYNGLMPFNTAAYPLTVVALKAAYEKVVKYIGMPLDFRGRESGAKLQSWEGYPDNYPRLQITAEQVEGKDVYRLAFWSWQDDSVWMDYSAISYLPKGTQSNTGYWYVPLTQMELGRFLLGRSTALSAGKTPKEAVAAGRASMFFRNEIVYWTEAKVYDPWTGSDMASLPEGGKWVWKWVDGWNMLWCGVQEFIDKFLKVPYNVRDLVAYGESYENVMKKALTTSDVNKRREKMVNYLSNIDFLVQPTGSMGFWDKLASYTPVIMGGIISVFTAGLTSPYLIAAGALVASTLISQGKKQQAASLQKLLNQQYGNIDNVEKDEVDKAVEDLDGNKSGALLFIGGGILLYFLFRDNKKKRGTKKRR